MTNNHISQLENKIENIVEGLFNQLFHRRVSAQDITLSVSRAMESGLRIHNKTSRPVAPDTYEIQLHPETLAFLAPQQESIEVGLCEYVIALAKQASYQLDHIPRTILVTDNSLKAHEVIVKTAFQAQQRQHTEAMQPIRAPRQTLPISQIIINGSRQVQLEKSIISIGRAVENDIVIDDAYISRQHLQLRARDGVYLLFDVQGQGKTRVNHAIVREHLLQSGDVIYIGQTQMLYMVDNKPSSQSPSTTSSIDTVEL